MEGTEALSLTSFTLAVYAGKVLNILEITIQSTFQIIDINFAILLRPPELVLLDFLQPCLRLHVQRFQPTVPRTSSVCEGRSRVQPLEVIIHLLSHRLSPR